MRRAEMTDIKMTEEDVNQAKMPELVKLASSLNLHKTQGESRKRGIVTLRAEIIAEMRALGQWGPPPTTNLLR